MKRAERKYVLETNLLIEALRDAVTNARLIQFHAAFAPFEYLHSVVNLQRVVWFSRVYIDAPGRGVRTDYSRKTPKGLRISRSVGT